MFSLFHSRISLLYHAHLCDVGQTSLGHRSTSTSRPHLPPASPIAAIKRKFYDVRLAGQFSQTRARSRSQEAWRCAEGVAIVTIGTKLPNMSTVVLDKSCTDEKICSILVDLKLNSFGSRFRCSRSDEVDATRSSLCSAAPVIMKDAKFRNLQFNSAGIPELNVVISDTFKVTFNTNTRLSSYWRYTHYMWLKNFYSCRNVPINAHFLTRRRCDYLHDLAFLYE